MIMEDAKRDFVEMAYWNEFNRAVGVESVSPYQTNVNARESAAFVEKEAEAWWEWRFEGRVLEEHCPSYEECPSSGQTGCDCYKYISFEWTAPYDEQKEKAEA